MTSVIGSNSQPWINFLRTKRNQIITQIATDILEDLSSYVYSTLQPEVTDLSTYVYSTLQPVVTEFTDLSARVGVIENEIKVIVGSYYKSVNQLASSGNTNISFDLSESWTIPGYIDLSTSQTEFVVNTAGLYVLSTALTVDPNAQTWIDGLRKAVVIDIIRGPLEAIFSNSVYPNSNISYDTEASGTVKLEIGDIIRIRSVCNLTSAGQYSIRGTTGNIDRNTWFTFQRLGS
jgi:hypothetical protein